MQDVPLSEPDNAATGSNDNVKSKSNSLKRLIQKVKKSGSNDATSSSEAFSEVKESDKETPKGTKDGVEAPTCSTQEKPSSHGKHTLKGTISTYWRNIFKRQQAVNKNAGPEVVQEQEMPTEDASKQNKEINLLPQIADEVHVLSISEDIEGLPQHPSDVKE